MDPPHLTLSLSLPPSAPCVCVGVWGKKKKKVLLLLCEDNTKNMTPCSYSAYKRVFICAESKALGNGRDNNMVPK